MADNPGIAFSNAFAQQQRIGIAERQQQYEQEAARKAEAEGHIKNLLGVAANITKAAAEAGKDPQTIAGSIEPLGQAAAEVAGSTYGPEGAARVQSMFRALLARPAGTNVSVVQTGEDLGGKQFSRLDKASGTITPIVPPSTAPSTLPSTDVITPQQVATANAPTAPQVQPIGTGLSPNAKVEQGFQDLSAKSATPTAPTASLPEGLQPGQPAIDYAVTNNITGDEFLKALPPSARGLVKDIAEYRVDPKSLSIRGGRREQILGWVSQYSGHTYDQKYYPATSAAIKEFLAGGNASPAGQMTAGNVAIQHLGTVADAVDRMSRVPGLLDKIAKSGTSFASYAANALKNKAIVGTSEGQALQAFLTARNRYAEEITKFYAGSQGAETDRQRSIDTLDAAKSVPEIYSALNTEGELLNGKVNALQDRWKTALAGPRLFDATVRSSVPNFPIVQQKSTEALFRIHAGYLRAKGVPTATTPTDPLGLFQ